MPKYWGKQIFTHEVGEKQKAEKKKEKEEEEKRRKKQVKTMASFVWSATTSGARKHAWTKRKKKREKKQMKTMASACKPPGPIRQYVSVRANLDFCRHVLKQPTPPIGGASLNKVMA